MENSKLLQVAKEASLLAGKAILEIYHTGDFNVQSKADNSPLTIADKKAHKIIAEHLEQTNCPVLSEEGKSIAYDLRRHWERYWLVDPLDGTKEFIEKSGEFTVNIALIEHQKPALGVVYAPVLDKLYFASKDSGAFLQLGESVEAIQVNKKNRTKKRIVASKSHLNSATQEFIESYSDYELTSIGSSLKLVLIAEGKADIYPRLAPTMEWDTAAAQVIVEVAGGKVLNFDSKEPLYYNKENLLNPHFVVYA